MDTVNDVPSARREALVGAVALIVTALVAYGLWLGFEISNLHNGLFALAYSTVGLYVVRMRPGHLVGTLFVASGLQAGVMFFGRQYALHDEPLPGADWLAWLSIWQVPLAIAISTLTILVFPTGRLLSRGWRVPAAVGTAFAVLLAAASATWPIEDDWRGGRMHFPFEVGRFETAHDVLWPVMTAGYQAFLVLWVVAVVVRIRRASGDESRQLRWFLFAVTLSTLVLVVGIATVGSPIPGLIATTLVPVAAGVAVVKHRLYGIDPVINKSIVVGALAVLVSVGYVAVVVGVGALLPVPDGVLSLVATALVAVAFEPVRRQAQRLADRLVYGHRATPYEALVRVTATAGAAPDDLLDGISATIANALGAEEVLVDATGAITVRKHANAPLTAAEARLLDDLSAQAALVIDRQAKDAELRAAARRVVTAQDDARRRIERDLHDGAQQRLVTLGAELGGLAEVASAGTDPELAERVRAARDRLLEATAQLREMARGLHPQVLTQDGLDAAIADLADVSPVPVRLDVDLPRRLPAEVEAAAYYLVSEAITNAARHSHATLVVVSARSDGSVLEVTVTDDGSGGADPAGGTGLQGLADRMAVLGARLVVDSPAGVGTTLRTVISCA